MTNRNVGAPRAAPGPGVSALSRPSAPASEPKQCQLLDLIPIWFLRHSAAAFHLEPVCCCVLLQGGIVFQTNGSKLAQGISPVGGRCAHADSQSPNACLSAMRKWFRRPWPEESL